MSDQKAERLLNLTMALLATSKYLTKSQIFTSVHGYQGTPEAMERMFERDKSELRSIGIEIEVAQIDNYFEDELGYRIRPDDYGLELGEISPRELAILSVAAKSWQNSTLSEESQSALRKMRSLGIPVDASEVPLSWVQLDSLQPTFDDLWDALDNHRTITFDYASHFKVNRKVDPYQLALWRGFWYLIGFDHDRLEIRTFKLTRFLSEITLLGRANSFTIPTDFQATEFLHRISDLPVQEAVILIRKNKGNFLRVLGEVTHLDDDWDQLTLNFRDVHLLARQVLWFGPDAKAVKPQELIDEIVQRLTEALQ